MRNGYRTVSERILGVSIDRGGHPYVILSSQNRQKTRKVHDLVAEAFLPDYLKGRASGKFVCHRDGRPDNNLVSNLKMATCRQNHEDMRSHGSVGKGSGNPRAKLTLEDVLQIRKEYPTVRAALLADRYGVSRTQVFSILKRTSWNPEIWVRDADAQDTEFRRSGSNQKSIHRMFKKTFKELSLLDPQNESLSRLKRRLTDQKRKLAA